jgi:integrase
MTVYGGLRLTTLEVKNAQPKEKGYTLIDGGGLQLTVKIDGKKIWEIRYTVDGKPNKTTIGSFPTVSLKEARLIRDEFKLKLAQGSNPVHEKKRIKEEKLNTIKEIESKSLNTFEKISRDFIESISNEHTPRYLTLKLARLENHIFPYFGSTPIRDVTRMMIVECMELLKLAGKIETARRVLTIVNEVYRYAVTREITPTNITLDIDRKYVIGRHIKKHMSTITEPKEVGRLLDLIDEYHGEFIVKYALQMGIYTCQRPYNIRFAEWDEFDLEKNIWSIPAEKMKMKKSHVVPINKQVRGILDALIPFSKERSRYVFPSLYANQKPISDGTMNKALRRIGYGNDDIVPHGFRAMFSTLANENIHIHGHSTEVIERQLSHIDSNRSKLSYNHAQYWEQRVGLMDWYGDYLDSLRLQQQSTLHD